MTCLLTSMRFVVSASMRDSRVQLNFYVKCEQIEAVSLVYANITLSEVEEDEAEDSIVLVTTPPAAVSIWFSSVNSRFPRRRTALMIDQMAACSASVNRRSLRLVHTSSKSSTSFSLSTFGHSLCRYLFGIYFGEKRIQTNK